MIAIGMGLAFLAYVGVLWGYCLVRGYNITLGDMFRSTWPAKAAG